MIRALIAIALVACGSSTPEPEWKALLPEAGVLADCDAMIATFEKGMACAKLGDEGHAAQVAMIRGLKSLVEDYKNKTAKNPKSLFPFVVPNHCKEQDDKLKKAQAAAGC